MSDRTEGNRSISNRYYSEGPTLTETVIRPEEHYYLRRRVRKRYRFRPRWNLIVILLLFLIGNVLYLTLQNLVGFIGYVRDIQDRDGLYQEKLQQKKWLLSEKEHRHSDEYIGEAARRQGMIREGEQLVIIAQPLQEDEAVLLNRKKKDIVIEN